MCISELDSRWCKLSTDNNYFKTGDRILFKLIRQLKCEIIENRFNK